MHSCAALVSFRQFLFPELFRNCLMEELLRNLLEVPNIRSSTVKCLSSYLSFLSTSLTVGLVALT
jgi:hypothetical protein